jgi:hypothetical protein
MMNLTHEQAVAMLAKLHVTPDHLLDGKKEEYRKTLEEAVAKGDGLWLVIVEAN